MRSARNAVLAEAFNAQVKGAALARFPTAFARSKAVLPEVGASVPPPRGGKIPYLSV